MTEEPQGPFRRAAEAPLLQRAVPVSEHLPGYGAGSARRDLVAAATVAALGVPAAMAYAQLAGLDPIVGLYGLLLPTIGYTLFGSSRQLIVGPESAIAALVGAAILPLAAANSSDATELAATLALLVAAFYALGWIARLGWIADYLSRPVLVGYIHGIAVVLVIGQLAKMLGVKIEAHDPIPQLVRAVGSLGDVSVATLAVALAALVILLLLRFLAPRLPAALIVVVLAIAASKLLDLEAHSVAVVGQIPSGLPGLTVPSPSASDFAKLVPAGVGIFLVGFADEILTARAFATRHGQHVKVPQELRAMGVSNALAGISGTMPVGASNSRTAVNDAMGARSQVAGLLAAGFVALVLLFLTGPLADLPVAVLGAVIVSAAISLVDVPAWRELRAADPVEFAIAGVTAAGVIVTGVLQAIAFAVGLSIVDVVRRSARPHDAVLGWIESEQRHGDVSVHADAVVTPGVVVYRIDDQLFFANASYFKRRVREALRGASTPTQWLVLDAEAIAHVDSAGLAALAELAEALPGGGVRLAVARMKTHVRRDLDAAGITEAIGADNFYGTVHAAVGACTARDRV